MSTHASRAPWAGDVEAAADRTSGLGGRLRRMPSWLLACAGVVVTFLALGLLGDALGGAPSGPASSSYATDSQGLAAWAELLRRTRHTVVQLRTPLELARLPPADTVVVLDPEALLPAEGRRLLAFTEAGGRLVVGGSHSQSTLPALIPRPPTWSSSGSPRQRALAGAGATVTGVAEVRGAGEGEWTDTRGYHEPLRGRDGGSLLLERDLGRGRLELLADASPVQNRLLASADNAQFALNLVGGRARPVVFVESVHGFGQRRGLAALPDAWRLAFALLAFAGLLWILARGRRLGPAEPAPVASQPPRAAYVEALALLLRRTHDPEALSSLLTRLRDRR